ncbi:hypothetical protein [Nonomuraea sp. NPDC005501]|uniref:hypothetical protein n=1 Tax=Nonomuraea sp. NPDC005501 TaxID=3156884 RepID=UPI0033A591A7
MTGPMMCPECGGHRGHRLGGLFLACMLCHGRGWVSGGREPEERPRPVYEPPPVWEDPRWLDPMVAGAFPCRYCLGCGTVSHVNRDRGILVTLACTCASRP